MSRAREVNQGAVISRERGLETRHDVYRLHQQGLDMRQMAMRLGVHERTVRRHLDAIKGGWRPGDGE